VTHKRPPTTHNSTVAPVVEPVPTVRTLMAPYTPIQLSLTVESGSLRSTSPSPKQTQPWSSGPSKATSTSLGLTTMPSKSGVPKILSWSYKEVYLFDMWCRDHLQWFLQRRMDYHKPSLSSRCYLPLVSSHREKIGYPHDEVPT